MENIKEYILNESASALNNWNDVEQALESFISDANLEKFNDDEDDNDIDEIISSFKEWLAEIWGIKGAAIQRTFNKFEEKIRYWFFDNGIVGTI